MQIEKFTTTNAKGEGVTAYVDRPVDGEPVGYALFVHCLATHPNRMARANISRGLTAQGIGVVHVDFTGQDGRGEDETSTSRAAGPDDLVAVAEFMREELGNPTLLVGHSIAGSAAILAASRIPSLTSIATIGAPFGVEHVEERKGGSDEKSTGANVHLDDQSFTLSKAFLADLQSGSLERAAAELSVPLLILHALKDSTIAVDNGTELFQAARHPKSFVALDDADHLLSDEADSRYVGNLLASWVGKYVDAALQEAKYIRPDDNRIYSHTGESGYFTEILANGHPLVADEPKSVGGTDAGPSPYDYIAAALGACTGMTLRMYADRKDWPLKGITVRLKHEKIHARDCETCETDGGNIDHIEREIELAGPLSDEQRSRLIEIANRCPVHQTLAREVRISTKESAAP